MSHALRFFNLLFVAGVFAFKKSICSRSRLRRTPGFFFFLQKRGARRIRLRCGTWRRRWESIRKRRAPPSKSCSSSRFVGGSGVADVVWVGRAGCGQVWSRGGGGEGVEVEGLRGSRWWRREGAGARGKRSLSRVERERELENLAGARSDLGKIGQIFLPISQIFLPRESSRR